MKTPSSYIDKDADMPRVLRTKDFWHWELAHCFDVNLHLPGVVAAKYAGPAVVLSSFLAAAVAVAGCSFGLRRNGCIASGRFSVFMD